MKMEEDLFRPAFNLEDAKGHLFNGGPLNNKVVRIPQGVDVYKYNYMGYVHTYRVYSAGAFYQSSEKF